MTALRYRKIGYVLAEQATAPGKIDTPEGVMSYETGDYLVTDAPPTHMWPVKQAIFERTYVRKIGYVLPFTDADLTVRRELDEFADVIKRGKLL